VAFGSNKFNNSAKGFNGGLSKGFKNPSEKKEVSFASIDNPFKFTPGDNDYKSRIRFYDRDALWTRWRRGYELYTVTQSYLGSFADQRSNIGDFRSYCAYQLYPGIFIPARLFSFPTNTQEINEQIVGIRDANGINFYDYGLPILAVRYLSDVRIGSYTQVGNSITVSLTNHNYRIGESVYLVFTSGTAVTATLPITAATANTFTCLAAAPLTTAGGVSVQLSTTFDDIRWTETRVRVRAIFDPLPALVGERLVDRVVERDPGISSSYTRVGTTVSVTCSEPHGLTTGNTIFANVLGGNVASRQYVVTVTSTTQLQFTTIDSGVTGGSLIVTRLISGYDYENYVGYTVTAINTTTKEIVFQRDDSYGAKLVNNKATTTVPAERGFIVGRFLTTEMRYQCTCQDFVRRIGYNLYADKRQDRFPVTPITSVKPGQRLNRDNTITNERDNDGVFSDLGYIAPVANFYQLPDYADTTVQSYQDLKYYQLRWCKHIYAALYSINHDEGNLPLLGTGTYSQSGPNIFINVTSHNLSANSKIQIDFTSGSAISGEYTITTVVDANTFEIVYPFSGVTNGYCTISNIKRHQHVDAWLLEPNDKPVGDGLDTFYENFTEENKKLRKTAERLAMKKLGSKWVGTTSVVGPGGLPQDVANYTPQLLPMMLTDDIRRVEDSLNRGGILQNETQRLISLVSKLFNVEPSVILSEKFGMLDQPLYNYTAGYAYGLVNNATYLNGVPYSVPGVSTTTVGTVTEIANKVTVLDCATYNPYIDQEYTVDGGTYSN
jgi:hypothetical protein